MKSRWRIYYAAILIVCAGCSGADDPYPACVSNLSDIESYDYVPWGSRQQQRRPDTLILQRWYDSRQAGRDDILLRFPADMVKVGPWYWIADPMAGKVYAYDAGGAYHQTVLGRGEGPGEVLQPVALAVSVPAGGRPPKVCVLDAGTRSLLVLSADGKERYRLYHPTIDRSFVTNWVRLSRDATARWPTFSHPKYLVMEVDSAGAAGQPRVERLLPPGVQPQALNGVRYDQDRDDGNRYAFAYVGLPLLFLHQPGRATLIELLPMEERGHDLPAAGRGSGGTRHGVRHYIKDLYLRDGRVFVLCRNDLYVIGDGGRGLTKYTLQLPGGEQAGFHKMVIAGDSLFLFNRSYPRIYTAALPDRVRNHTRSRENK